MGEQTADTILAEAVVGKINKENYKYKENNEFYKANEAIGSGNVLVENGYLEGADKIDCNDIIESKDCILKKLESLNKYCLYKKNQVNKINEENKKNEQANNNSSASIDAINKLIKFYLGELATFKDYYCINLPKKKQDNESEEDRINRSEQVNNFCKENEMCNTCKEKKDCYKVKIFNTLRYVSHMIKNVYQYIQQELKTYYKKILEEKDINDAEITVKITNQAGLQDYIWVMIKHKYDISDKSVSVFYRKKSNDDLFVELCLETKSTDKVTTKQIGKDILGKLKDTNFKLVPMKKLVEKYWNDDDSKSVLKSDSKSVPQSDRCSDYGHYFKEEANEVSEIIKNLWNVYLSNLAKIDYIQSKIFVAISNDCKQLVLTGAPGTGKTFSAEEYAKENDPSGIYKQVQFHPSYDYTDFVEGIRPINVEPNKMKFKKIDGHFKAFCREVVKNNVTDYLKKKNSDKDGEKIIKVFSRKFPDEREKNIEGLIKDIEKLSVEEKKNITEFIKGFPEEKNEKEQTFCDDLVRYILNNTYDGKEKRIREVFLKKTSDNDVKKIIEEFSQAKVNKVADDIKFDDSESIIDGTYEGAQTHYFIIDEINRADVSKVFGELMYLFEKRGVAKRKPTQYQKLKTCDKNGEVLKVDCFEDGFFIPKNIVIIGTMNDIDKSVESFDFAMRRRFRWIPVEVEKELLVPTFNNMLKEQGITSNDTEKLSERIIDMNKELCELSSLSHDYDIGPVYFKKYKKSSNEGEINTVILGNIFDSEIAPTIREYLRNRKNINVDYIIGQCRKALCSTEEK